MNKDEARSIIKSNIKAYRLQRNNEVYNNSGIKSIVEVFRIHYPNIAMLPDNILAAGAGIALLAGTLYAHQITVHPLTKKISKLRDLDSSISTTDLVKDITADEFEEIARVKVYK